MSQNKLLFWGIFTELSLLFFDKGDSIYLFLGLVLGHLLTHLEENRHDQPPL
jgi:hypothetical protein